MTTEVTIDLDRVHRAVRSQDRWAIMKRQPDGSWDSIDVWSGGRRSLFHHCDQHGISPSREAEAVLERLPESVGFRERMT